jgi:hypothetical protein
MVFFADRLMSVWNLLFFLLLLLLLVFLSIIHVRPQTASQDFPSRLLVRDAAWVGENTNRVTLKLNRMNLRHPALKQH